MFAEQFLFALLQRPAARIFIAELGKAALNADELATRIIVFVEPVGVDQSRRIVVGMRQNVVQKSVLDAHTYHVSSAEIWIISTPFILQRNEGMPSSVPVPSRPCLAIMSVPH